MNFFPLCTAIVCPIISGTIVERRDQVFTTFFSFRVFSPSTFSRRWPSTNGPFFSERAIDSLFLHSAQAAPRRAPHLLESPHRPRNAVRLRTKRAHKPRALRVRNPLHNHPQPGLHSLYRTGSGGGTTTFPVGRAGFVLFAAARFTTLFAGRAERFAAARRIDPRRPAVLAVRVALIAFALAGPLCHHRPASSACCVTLVRIRPLLPSLHNVPVRTLVIARLFAQRRERPRRLRMVALHFAFTAAVRVIHRVHGHAANGWLDAAPARAARFAESLVFVVEIAHLPDRRHAIQRKLAYFAGRQLHQSNVAFLAQKLRRAACRANHLPAAPRIQL